MQEYVTVTGMIIKTVPIGEYDRRLVVLTKECGKITVFAKGARRPNSKYVASTNLFCFGTFKMYEGKSAYNLIDVEITNYFEVLRDDFEGAYLGMYFLEIADYYTRENNDEKEMLKLLYQSMRAISIPSLNRKLVKAIYELKAVMVNGEFPGIPTNREYLDSTNYTVTYIQNSTIEKLYTFTVTEDVLLELEEIADGIRKRSMDVAFKSLAILSNML